MRLEDLRGRSVAVWGTGREGRAAVTAIAKHEPARLIAVDDSANYLSTAWEGEIAELAPLAGGNAPDPEAFAELCGRYALDMRPETLPELCARFGVWFPGVE